MLSKPVKFLTNLHPEMSIFMIMNILLYIYMGLSLNFYVFLYLHLYVFHSDYEGKIHYPHFTLFIPILEIWKVGLSEGFF